ncbi:hypothetical protein BH10PSE17_BH10PSE17_35540 [soil metagenome]
MSSVIAQANDSAPSRPAPPRYPLEGLRVLIADPNHASRSVLREAVTALGGNRVEVGSSASDVLRIVQSSPPELILCEYRLAGSVARPRDGQQLLEEMRARKLIPRSTVFVVITGERTYQSVVAAAEFTPDAYLLKPFSVDKLTLKLSHAMERRALLRKAWRLLEGDSADLAVHECRRLAKAHPTWFAEIRRLEIESLESLQRFDEAETVIASVLELAPAGWARMALARIRAAAGRPAEAEDLLHALIAEKPHYMPAYDLLARVKESLGLDHEALDVLERAATVSDHNVERLRRTGIVAQRMGLFGRAETAFTRVVERVRDSALLTGEDYANLAGALVAQNKDDGADELAAEQKRTMRGHPEVEFIASLIDFQRARRAGAQVEADAALDALMAAITADGERTAPGLQIQVLEACFLGDRLEVARPIAQALLARPGLERRWHESLEELLSIKPRVKKVAPKPTPVLPELAPAEELVAKLEAAGWEDVVGAQCRALLGQLEEVIQEDSDSGKQFAALQSRFNAVLARYGMRR